MKTTLENSPALYRAILFVIVIMSIFSCNSNPKSQDSKATAEDSNDAKFNDKATEKDAQFLVNAAEISLEEIELGKLAQHNSIKDDIAKLGKMMEQAHTKSLSDLSSLAKKKLITIPTEPTDKAESAYDNLNKKSGLDFDRLYSDMMVDGHKNAIEMFEKASNDSTDPDIKAWAIKTLPELRMHLERSTVCQKKYDKMKPVLSITNK